MVNGTTGATVTGHASREDDVALLAKLVADTLKDSITELRKDDEARMSRFTSTFQEALSAFREGEEKRFARLEKAVASWKPTKIRNDPITTFWTVYKTVADEHDDELVSKYVGNLDTSLLFAGLFSAVASAFIVQIIPELQPNPADLTNALLLQILNRFGGTTNPLEPVPDIPIGVVRAQSILLASLSVALFVAFVAVLGKQWILYYTRVTTWGNIVDRGKERQEKLVGLQKWGLHLVMEALPVMLQFALLLFGIALSYYLWDLDLCVAKVVLAGTSIGLAFFLSITVAASIWRDCPFQTPLSVLVQSFLPCVKEFVALARVRLKHCMRRSAIIFLRKFPTSNPAADDSDNYHYPTTLSNPVLWRHDPLFTPPIPQDIAASAGFWLLENSTDFSAVTAVAAVFSKFQWPAHHHSKTTLVRLRDAYTECFRAPKFDMSTRLKALQSAAAYYVLYHTRLIWSASNSLEVEIEGLTPDLPPDLFLHQHSDEWGGDDLFEYLLRVKDRSEPVNSARFLSYVAPYWFCGDSDTAVKFRHIRLEVLNELIEVLEQFRELNDATVTNCILCAGAVMDFPLHPEDLIRVDKSHYSAFTFQMVVEHIHLVVSAKDHRRPDAKVALEILFTLVKKTTVPLVDSAWINCLLRRAAEGDIEDDTFVVLLRFSARRREEDTAADSDIPYGRDCGHVQSGEVDPSHLGGVTIVTSENPTPGYTLLEKVLRNIETCGAQEGGWQDEAVYGGLITVRDIPGLQFYLPTVEFLQTLSKAMEKGENKPFRVRRSAYGVVLVARGGWLWFPELRKTLKDLDFPKKLHSVVIETGRSDHQRSFLEMMEILSEDAYWHSYLRGAMEIWLPFRHEGPFHALRILANVGQLLSPPAYDGYDPPLDRLFEKLVEDEWAIVPGRLPMNLTADRLEPLAEVTKQFKELLFTERDRRAVLTVVEQVIPSLEKRRDDGYEGPGEDIRRTVYDVLRKLREPTRSSRHRSKTTCW